VAKLAKEVAIRQATDSTRAVFFNMRLPEDENE